MSCQPSCSHSSRWPQPRLRSRKAERKSRPGGRTCGGRSGAVAVVVLLVDMPDLLGPGVGEAPPVLAAGQLRQRLAVLLRGRRTPAGQPEAGRGALAQQRDGLVAVEVADPYALLGRVGDDGARSEEH